MTPALFAKLVLTALSLPLTDNNVNSLVAAQRQEGGHQANRAWYNPLNTMQPAPGAVDAGLKVRGIKAYSSWNEGITATAKTLAQANMSGIVAALKRSAPPEETLKTFSDSPWGWYEIKDGVRVPVPHTAATELVKSPTLLAKYATSPYREAINPPPTPRKKPGWGLVVGLGLTGLMLYRRTR